MKLKEFDFIGILIVFVLTCFALCLILFITGCTKNFTGTITTPKGEYKISSNASMLLSVTEPNGATIESDSRTKGIIESLALEFGFSKSEYNPYDYGY